ncbi:MAG: translation initiation factor IF-2 subunit beta [Acidilobaceae archaeon]|nr:translation initiation factor IF-2 subunit beta [Acidilobaceae archaeon]MCX8165251.1 translation initiation factor IF-2 subunit beta [Acidilobaceae archaeon]MDW7973677.1 translation initiation factor IF-2 subunit beta [Sulfolobales archaeon]
MEERLKDYRWLLERVYKKIPPRPEAEGIALPEPELIRVGDQTIIKNFREISMKLKREPAVLTRYLLRELNAGGSYDENSGQLRVGIKVSKKPIEQLLQRFEKAYVRCPTCGSIDTKLLRRERNWSLICEACGAEQAVKPI